MQKATKHRNFAGSGTFQPLCTKVHHAAPTGAKVLLWYTIIHWCTIMHWCTLVNKKPPGAVVQKYHCGTRPPGAEEFHWRTCAEIFPWSTILHWCISLQKHTLSSSSFSAKVHFSLWFKWQQRGVFQTEVNLPQYSRNLRPVLSPCLTQLLGLAQELQPQMNCNCKLKLLLITSS